MEKSCAQCGSDFVVDDRDLAFYDKISPLFGAQKYQIPPPTLCPQCRMQRRTAWRGKDYFFRKCDLSGEVCLSIYPPEAKMVTYSSDAFYGDGWNGLDYGRDFDFSKTFFDQFMELWRETPKHIANAKMNENCDYIINAHKNKDCYMVDEVDRSRDCLYGYNVQDSTNVVSGFYVRKSELCYEISQAENCYGVFFSHNVYNSHSSAYLRNCRNVKNSLFCVNMRGSEYHVFNQPVSKETFEEEWAKVFTGLNEDVERARTRFEEFALQFPVPAVIQNNTEECTGDQIANSKDCLDCYNVDNSRDCRYSTDIHYSKDAYDVHIYEGDLMYECLHAGPKGYNQIGAHLSWFTADCYYSSEVHSCKNVFGCSGLIHAQYCILNKQYTKEEYELLVPKIISHMQETGEWGEFFPAYQSPFGYNQTMAAYYFPLTSEQAHSQGFNWHDLTEQVSGSVEPLPDRLDEVPDGEHVFASEESGKSFKVIPQELTFHRRYNIPLPRITPSERVFRFVQRSPRKLYQRQCQKCNREIASVYPADRPEMVYCLECYLESTS